MKNTAEAKGKRLGVMINKKDQAKGRVEVNSFRRRHVKLPEIRPVSVTRRLRAPERRPKRVFIGDSCRGSRKRVPDDAEYGVLLE
ncbi:hypothetical protein CY34DRAFT_617094 [Suillus luteus UH-Slu-Lm8-n1]|uniref:Uncharacterized protein n=1 Tax=Suillus luteus UH-Slu-Lm8-n1 TaxID=930992 RepID=A0A0C9ZZ39_9AGAM|nr:hypothetical protein CY34DRAFT_617094 [Suillus luteus UH-Slu-Lm8-n1]